MNKSLITIFLIVVAAYAWASGEKLILETRAICSDSLYEFIEEKVSTSDDQGHGPDIGSEEWKSVVEFKLGIRDKLDVPKRDSKAWCHHIDEILKNSSISSTRSLEFGQAVNLRGPSFNCKKVKSTSIEAMICGNEELSALDRKLSSVYKASSLKASNEHPPVLQAEQRGWIKGRNDCWKSDDKLDCIRNEYTLRISELQAMYRLVPYNGPVRFICGGNMASEIVATFFETDPLTLIVERGDSVSLMHLQPNGSEAKYQGRNEIFWENDGKAFLIWGYGAPEIHCKKAP